MPNSSSSLGFVVLARRPGQPDEPVSAVFPAYPNGLEQAQNALEGCQSNPNIARWRRRDRPSAADEGRVCHRGNHREDTMSDETVPLACDCGQEYEIRDDTPDWAAPWIMCPRCYLSDGVKFYSSDLT